jgi:hypothetical protein
MALCKCDGGKLARLADCHLGTPAIGATWAGGKWLRGLDSNQDNQLQRLACYQLHYPGVAEKV